MSRSGLRPAVVLVVAAGWLLVGIPVAAALGVEDFSAQVTFTTDYVFRGVSQTGEEPAVQGSITYEHRSGFFAGLWGSNVDFPTTVGLARPPDLELNFHLGYDRELGDDWSVYAAFVHYEYPGNAPDFSYDYDELHLGAQYRELAAVVVSLAEDALGQGEPSAAVELTGRYPLPGNLDLEAGVGHFDLQGPYGGRYWYGNLGLSRRIGSFLLDLGYFATDNSGEKLYGPRAGDRVVLSVTATTP